MELPGLQDPKIGALVVTWTAEQLLLTKGTPAADVPLTET
jgi:hypothetical protein